MQYEAHRHATRVSYISVFPTSIVSGASRVVRMLAYSIFTSTGDATVAGRPRGYSMAVVVVAFLYLPRTALHCTELPSFQACYDGGMTI